MTIANIAFTRPASREAFGEEVDDVSADIVRRVHMSVSRVAQADHDQRWPHTAMRPRGHVATLEYCVSRADGGPGPLCAGRYVQETALIAVVHAATTGTPALYAACARQDQALQVICAGGTFQQNKVTSLQISRQVTCRLPQCPQCPQPIPATRLGAQAPTKPMALRK